MSLFERLAAVEDDEDDGPDSDVPEAEVEAAATKATATKTATGSTATADDAPAPSKVTTTKAAAAIARRSAAEPAPADPVPARPTAPPIDRLSSPLRRSSRDDALAATKHKVRGLVLDEVAPRMGGLEGDALQAEVRGAIERILLREDVRVSPRDRRSFVEELMADTLGYGPLDPLLHDESVTEIMCNGYDEVWVERDGLIVEAETHFTDDDHYRKVIERIVSAVGRRVDESSPMVDARLPDGSRVNAVIPPLAVRGSVLTIRKFAADPLTAMDLVDKGTYTLDLITVLDACVRGKLNMLVSGGTGTGKTTNLNVMSSFVPPGERIITIEDSAELQLQQAHVVSLEARPPNAEGRGEVMIRDLVRNALRMRPDRIIVGECRAAEALDMLQAMNTGHEGSMTTVHANSSRDALSRLETMVLMAGFDLPVRAIREQIAAAIDLVLQVERLPDGRRVVTALTEVQGLEGDVFLLQDVFRFDHHAHDGRGGLVATGLRPRFADRLRDAGHELPAHAFRAPAKTARPAPGRGSAKVPVAAAVADREVGR